MLNFNEFAEYVEKNIKGALPESVSEKCEVSLHNVKKNNDTELCGIMIKNPKQIVAPVLYLEGFYQAYQDGASLEKCVCKIAENVVKIEFSNIPDFANDIADEKAETPEKLAEMVKAVNGSNVAIEEQLSDHVYRFCAETHEFKIADIA